MVMSTVISVMDPSVTMLTPCGDFGVRVRTSSWGRLFGRCPSDVVRGVEFPGIEQQVGLRNV